MGNDYVFQMLAAGNVETLDRYRMGERTIVTACPHCFNTLGNEYGQLGGNYRVVHHSTYLAELVSSGRLVTLPEDADGVDRRPPAGQRHRPRLVLPRPLQRRRLGAARRARCGGRDRHRDGEVRSQHVLLRRRRRPDVDGGGPRDADQRRTDASGPRDRRRDRRDGLPVLHGHAERRARAASDGGSAAVASMDMSELLAARIAAAPADRRLPVI